MERTSAPLIAKVSLEDVKRGSYTGYRAGTSKRGKRASDKPMCVGVLPPNPSPRELVIPRESREGEVFRESCPFEVVTTEVVRGSCPTEVVTTEFFRGSVSDSCQVIKTRGGGYSSPLATLRNLENPGGCALSACLCAHRPLEKQASHGEM